LARFAPRLDDGVPAEPVQLFCKGQGVAKQMNVRVEYYLVILLLVFGFDEVSGSAELWHRRNPAKENPAGAG
jgi:hypothetical protein